MSEQTYDDDDYQDNENDSAVIRNLRAEAKRAKQLEAELAKAREQEQETRAMQQELAMRRAGIDPATPMAQMFAKAYPDLRDVDSLQSEWQKIAGSTGPQTDPGALQRIASASAGGESTGGAGFDITAALDSIPLVVDGQYNPDYQNQVLRITQEAAAREGREFGVSGGQVTWQPGAPGPGPVTAAQ
jgi:hypothetical protein